MTVAGMVQALGVNFVGCGKRSPLGRGGEPTNLAHIDLSGLDKRLADCRIEVACDVNPTPDRRDWRFCGFLVRVQGRAGDGQDAGQRACALRKIIARSGY